MECHRNYDLTSHNSYKLKAACRRAFFPEFESDFIDIYSKFSEKNDLLNKILIGRGYNIILSKSYYNQDFIIVGDSFNSLDFLGDGLISAEAGASTLDLSTLALENELTGAEVFYDIPSSIGGAVVMNAGASGEEIKDILVKVRYLDLVDFQIKEIENQDIGFCYRNSFFQQNPDKIVLKAWFMLKRGSYDRIKEKMERVKVSRWSKQPKKFPNAGSVFKRPTGFYVGKIIEDLGLKGFTIGGAKISEKHGGFIINYNNATGSDIIAIINFVQERVKEKYQIEIEVEQRII
ncbi:UDP-N-acetylmuramate dehydrogenase [Flavilitoribacter nigricans]|uniref:UDP-N-acetylenolpyruvoylglucosamine reductase n=1 Tax=Flavilitoribacter nigricans (strain ATCC 23147 / DSM 23189 / NBRC 102662 / NCIMB 1420 / SS-2) TaxID=1122177 RepID=A0A2D0MYY0_FLAN2|nr:UDP-N-acetylmuramate dehydrogenase [Flavilitoribacter nigricans]PHN01492.1 UDP-N-acetylenolpyruvoylglucosamine reductase [Flavilitoribacter nigricans DSM 23189 = NBRC 102662]